MLAWFVRTLGWLWFIPAFLCSGVVLAADEDQVVVVDVRASAQSLDADALRRRIGAELHANAVRPDDPLASTARGTITIEADHDKREIAVRYDGVGEPMERRIPLSSDPETARESVVLMAGNLARDEATELASQLRDQTADRTRPATAGANTERPVERPKALPPRKSNGRPDAELRLEALVGLGFSLHDATGHDVNGGGLVSFRYRSVLVAPSVTWGGEALFGQTHRDLRIGLGGSFALPAPHRAQWGQVEVLGVGGVHEYQGFGASPFGPGANRDRAFLGIWAGYSVNFLRHLAGGGFLFYEGDLSRAMATSPVSLPIFGPSQTTFSVGQDAVGLMCRFGASFNL